MVTLLGVELGEGTAFSRGTHAGSGGIIWEIRKQGSLRSKTDVAKQRVVLLATVLARFPGALLRWKGTPPVDGNQKAFASRAPYTWSIPADASAEKLYALVESGEWLVYATPKRRAVDDQRMDVWGDLDRKLLLSTLPDVLIGARAGGEPWIFWIRPGLGG